MADTNYGTTIAERLKTEVSQWTEALNAHGRGLRVALPCIVKSFNAAAQTIVALPATHETELVAGVSTINVLPELHDVPILVPRAGGYSLTLPIAAGDECLVVFTDTALDAWWQSGGRLKEVKRRRHTLADGIAIFGPWSQPRVLANYSTSSAQLRSDTGSVVVDVAASQVTVTAPTVQVNASAQANVTAPTVNVAGSAAVHITGAGATTIEGRNFLNHTHSGVQSGSASSGPVV